tara:strand:- start:1 stop:135 length:135 start_codon:yes stop_codon:yes gene_type:complete
MKKEKSKKINLPDNYIDKLASLKYVSKKDSKLLSSIVSDVLKKK